MIAFEKSFNPLLVLSSPTLQALALMLDRILRRALLLGLLPCIALTGCSRMPKMPSLPKLGKKKPPAIATTADPTVAAATSFSVTLIETDVARRGTIASGSISLDAPLAQATSGTYSLRPSSSNAILPTGKSITSALQSNRSGKIQATHSGTLTILKFLNKDGDELFKVMGPPHHNMIKDHWFHHGADSGLANISPKS